jgi:uncharacterized protein GlcG (DUF336 family)
MDAFDAVIDTAWSSEMMMSKVLIGSLFGPCPEAGVVAKSWSGSEKGTRRTSEMFLKRFLRQATVGLAMSLCVIVAASTTLAQGQGSANSASNRCGSLPNHAALKTALNNAVIDETSGLDLHMWATLVDRDGIVCAVAFSGVDRGAQWPGSRVISAQKANTANAFSLDGLSLSTANLYSAVQPGGSLFGLQESNPVDVSAAYKGPSSNYGQSNDPLVGQKIGGVNVFGGGLALYNSNNKVVGGVGLSGDTSCADHFIAWRVRKNLNLDHLLGAVGGVSGDGDRPDNIVFDITDNPDGGTGVSAGGFGHPTCLNTGEETDLPPVVN